MAAERKAAGREAGILIAFEGIDGSGKGTALEAVRAWLLREGHDAVFLRDPGDTALGERLRAVLLDPALSGMAPAAELLLYLASRAQLAAEKIRPALAAGRVVVLDRFWLSTVVYQTAFLKTLPAAFGERLLGIGLDDMPEARWLLFDVPAEQAMARLKRTPDRMEARGVAFLEAVRQRYLDAARNLPADAVRVLDAARPPEAVAADAVAAVAAWLDA